MDEEKKRSNGLPEMPEVGIPEENKVKRRYTMSDAARAQRKKAGSHPKGDSVARNAWRHGLFAQGIVQHSIKPCKTTCPDYPCELVEEGEAKPGGDCLDKKSILEAYGAIRKALAGDNKDFQDLAALRISKSMYILEMVQEAIGQDGVLLIEDVLDKDGGKIGIRFKEHPLIKNLSKLMETLGITPKEFEITPRAKSRKGAEEKGTKTVGDIMSLLVKGLQKEDD